MAIAETPTKWAMPETGLNSFYSPFLVTKILILKLSRGLSWAGWHHIAGIPQWVTAWGFVALFIGIVAVFIKCGKEDFNL